MNHTICYISKAKEGLTDLEIQEIFTTTQTRNNAENIKGILLYGFGNFFQVLEGEKKIIEDLYLHKISEDKRHSDILTIINYHIKHPIFEAYSSEFNIVKTNNQLDTIKAYLNQNSLHHLSKNIQRMLNPFLL
ncbi:MAG: blue light sensor protein [Flavobacteriaceae bacterium]|nr:blue light sensor protein [Flavobacteriaceae bacterium]